MAADIDGTLAVFAVAAWSDGEEGQRICVQALDDYIAAISGTASDRYNGLQRLATEAENVVRNQAHSAFILNAINVRLVEVTASMVGVNVASVSSDLVKD